MPPGPCAAHQVQSQRLCLPSWEVRVSAAWSRCPGGAAVETVRGCSSPAGPAGAGHSEPRSAWRACTETARGDNMLSCILCKCRWGWSSETRWALSPCLPFMLPRCPGDLLKGQTMRASLGNSWGEASAATEAEQPAAPLMGPHFPSSRDFSCQAWSPVPLGHVRVRGECRSLFSGGIRPSHVG